MKEKLFRVAIIVSALLFLVSFFLEGWLKILFLTVALVGVLSIFPSVKKIKSVGTKSSYAMFLFWVCSKLTMAMNLVLCSNIFSGVTMILALIVAVRSALYVHKYCRRDADEHLDEL